MVNLGKGIKEFLSYKKQTTYLKESYGAKTAFCSKNFMDVKTIESLEELLPSKAINNKRKEQQLRQSWFLHSASFL